MENLKNRINSHLVTLLLEDEDRLIILNERKRYDYHINCLQDINRQLEYCGKNFNIFSDDETEYYYGFINNGCIVIANLSLGDRKMYYILVPAVLSKKYINIVIQLIKDFNEADFFFCQQNGEHYCEIDIDEFLHKNNMALTLKKRQ